MSAGPYETERQAADAVRHIIDSRVESWTDGCHRLMDDACTAAGVRLGSYDQRILLWLAGALRMRPSGYGPGLARTLRDGGRATNSTSISAIASWSQL
jgi:hypothetical protein